MSKNVNMDGTSHRIWEFPTTYKAVRPKRKFKKIVEAVDKTLISAGLAMLDFLTDLTIASAGVWSDKNQPEHIIDVILQSA